MRVFAWTAALTLVALAQADAAPGMQRTAAASLAHPAVTGAAGPFRRVVVTLRSKGSQPDAAFAGTLRTSDGRSLPLAGPDEPADFFLFDVTAVLFTPIARTGGNAVVVLYDSSRIGPGHGTDRRALVYRVGRTAAERVPAVEARLEGAGNAAEVRRRLRRGIR